MRIEERLKKSAIGGNDNLLVFYCVLRKFVQSMC